MRDKARALQEMSVPHSPFVYISADATAAAAVRLILPIGPHPTNRNEVIAWDLSKDPRELLDLDAESIRLRLFTPHEQRPEDFEPMPLYAIAANKSPAVFRDPRVLSRERAVDLDIDIGAAMANVPILLAILKTLDLPRLLQVVYARDPVKCDAEEALYEGFIGHHDRRALDELRSMDPAGLAAIKPMFSDSRLDELFLRFKARHYPGSLSQREIDKWEEHRYSKLITGYAGSRTVAMVRASVVEWQRTFSESIEPVDPAKFGILDDILAYTNDLAAEIDPYDAEAGMGVPLTPLENSRLPSPARCQYNTICSESRQLHRLRHRSVRAAADQPREDESRIGALLEFEPLRGRPIDATSTFQQSPDVVEPTQLLDRKFETFASRHEDGEFLAKLGIALLRRTWGKVWIRRHSARHVTGQAIEVGRGSIHRSELSYEVIDVIHAHVPAPGEQLILDVEMTPVARFQQIQIGEPFVRCRMAHTDALDDGFECVGCPDTHRKAPRQHTRVARVKTRTSQRLRSYAFSEA